MVLPSNVEAVFANYVPSKLVYRPSYCTCGGIFRAARRAAPGSGPQYSTYAPAASLHSSRITRPPPFDALEQWAQVPASGLRPSHCTCYTSCGYVSVQCKCFAGREFHVVHQRLHVHVLLVLRSDCAVGLLFFLMGRLCARNIEQVIPAPFLVLFSPPPQLVLVSPAAVKSQRAGPVILGARDAARDCGESSFVAATRVSSSQPSRLQKRQQCVASVYAGTGDGLCPDLRGTLSRLGARWGRFAQSAKMETCYSRSAEKDVFLPRRRNYCSRAQGSSWRTSYPLRCSARSCSSCPWCHPVSVSHESGSPFHALGLVLACHALERAVHARILISRLLSP